MQAAGWGGAGSVNALTSSIAFSRRMDSNVVMSSARQGGPDYGSLGVVNGLGVWWRKLGLNGTNVNQLTNQNLTDLGHGPTFYDCLVEVAAVPAGIEATCQRLMD